MTTRSDDQLLRRYLVWFPEQFIEIEKDHPYVIGRLPQCEIRVPATVVSKHHAVVTWSDDGVGIQDFGSTNGTFVNGSRVSHHWLENEDEIRVAGRVFSFVLAAQAESGRFFAHARQLRQSQMTQALDVDEMTNRPEGFAGNLADIGVPELIQVMQLTRKTGLIRLYSGEREGHLWIREGDILTAIVDGERGEEQFYSLFTLQEGLFEFRPMEFVARDASIQTKTSALLVEGFRRLEELRAKQAKEGVENPDVATVVPSPPTPVGVSVTPMPVPQEVTPIRPKKEQYLDTSDSIPPIAYAKMDTDTSMDAVESELPPGMDFVIQPESTPLPIQSSDSPSPDASGVDEAEPLETQTETQEPLLPKGALDSAISEPVTQDSEVAEDAETKEEEEGVVLEEEPHSDSPKTATISKADVAEHLKPVADSPKTAKISKAELAEHLQSPAGEVPKTSVIPKADVESRLADGDGSGDPDISGKRDGVKISRSRTKLLDADGAAIAAYVHIVFEQVVSPLLFERQQKLSGYIGSSKVRSDRITMKLTSQADAEKSAWLELVVEKERVMIRSNAVEGQEIQGRPQPFELTRPFRTSLDAFMDAFVV